MPQTTRPVLIDLGKVKRKDAKLLKDGDGPLVEDVSDAISLAIEQLPEVADNAVFVPVVVLYERKPKKGATTLTLPFGFTR